MKASEILIKAIKEFEGCKLTAYKCPAGVWTIGVGHTKNVTPGMKISEFEATQLLHKDLAVFERCVNELQVTETQGQFDALVDFAFNLGTKNLTTSTLLKRIRAKAPKEEIRTQFMKWTYATVNGRKIQLSGLIKRRKWEYERFFSTT